MDHLTIVLCMTCILLASCAQPIERELREDLQLQQEVIDELKDENRILRDTNSILRDELIVTKERLLHDEEIVRICEENYPPLSNASQVNRTTVTHVPITDILLSRESVIINVPDLNQGIVSATRSMEPFLDQNDVVLERAPDDPAEIHEDDIIIFERDGVRIIHRVVEIGHDEQGWYASTKGDNNLRRDPEKVRFGDVRGVVVGVIY